MAFSLFFWQGKGVPAGAGAVPDSSFGTPAAGSWVRRGPVRGVAVAVFNDYSLDRLFQEGHPFGRPTVPAENLVEKRLVQGLDLDESGAVCRVLGIRDGHHRARIPLQYSLTAPVGQSCQGFWRIDLGPFPCYLFYMLDTQSLEAVASFAELEERVRENPLLLLYATRPGCGVCGALRPKIERMVERIAPLKGVYADLEEIPLLAGQLSLFSVPVLVVFIEGREALREWRNVSVPELEERLERLAALMG